MTELEINLRVNQSLKNPLMEVLPLMKSAERERRNMKK
jgi:hypothetical protein